MPDPAATTHPPAPAHYQNARVPRPPIPARRLYLPRDQHRFFPRLRDDSQHPTHWEFPEYLDGSVPWVGVLRELYASPLSFPASFSPQAGLLLHALVRNIRPRTALEIGSFIGISTIWIAAALDAGSRDPGQAPTRENQALGILHSFDDFGPIAAGPWREMALNSGRLPIVQESLRRAGLLDRVVLHPGDSGPTIRAFRDRLRSDEPAAEPGRSTGGVDFALIDGAHDTPGALEDLWAVEPVLNTGGYIRLHDTFPEQCGDHQGPRHILDHLREVAQGLYEPCELYTAPLNYGMALLRRVG
jgi:predicted O-methyltransferase YrrM